METNNHWEEVQPGTWKPEAEGDFIEGTLISKEFDVGVNKSCLYLLENKDERTSVWGSAVLDNRMKYIQVGKKIKIEYKGTQPNLKGQPTKIFKVFIYKPYKEETVTDTP